MLTREEGYPGDAVGTTQAFWLVSDRATDPAYASTTQAFDAVTYLSPVPAVQGLWPAVDPLLSHSKLLDAAIVGAEHLEVAHRVKELLRRAGELMYHPKFFEYLAHQAHRQAVKELEQFVPARLAELSPDDRALVSRARKLERYFTQPFIVAEPFSGRPGKTVGREQTVRDCRDIMDGRLDDVAEDAFRFIGAADEAPR
jgi:F-type H+-transporting ATPase subunit beta